MFTPPPIVERVWQAADRFYETGTLRDATWTDIVRLLKEDDPSLPASQSTVDRAHRRFPNLLPWPIKRGMRRPWLSEPEVVEDQLERMLVEVTSLDDGKKRTEEVVVDENGVLRLLNRWRRGFPNVAAVFSGVWLLDVLSDGRLDGIVRLCRLLQTRMHLEI